jgi:UDP-N-acetylglucosamine 3-dehydrogenase
MAGVARARFRSGPGPARSSDRHRRAASSCVIAALPSVTVSITGTGTAVVHRTGTGAVWNRAAEPAPCRLAVVGLGRQGRRHCLVASRNPLARVVATVDPTAPGLPGIDHVPSVADILALGLDGAVVATPTLQHAGPARELLEAGVPTLVEKPLAASAEEAEGLVRLAAATGTPLVVGHVERFNPAVRLVHALLEKGRLGVPIALSFRRVGLPPATRSEVDVIHDLAVHDIDVFTHLAAPSRLLGVSRWPAQDLAESAFLLLDGDGVSGSVQVNWRTPVRIREFTLTTDSSYVRANYTTQVVELFEATDVGDFEDFGEFQSHYGSASSTRFEPATAEPLAAQLSAFLDLLRRGCTGALATAQDGLVAVRTADAASRWPDVVGASVAPRPIPV